MKVVSISTCENEIQEIRNYEPLREVSSFVDQARQSIGLMENSLDELEQPAGELSKVVAVGLNALESGDNAETALWKTREELAILQFLFTMTEDNLEHFQQAFLVIRTLQEEVSDYKAAVRNIMTSQGASEGHLATARRKVRLLKVELPGIMEAVNEIEL